MSAGGLIYWHTISRGGPLYTGLGPGWWAVKGQFLLQSTLIPCFVHRHTKNTAHVAAVPTPSWWSTRVRALHNRLRSWFWDEGYKTSSIFKAEPSISSAIHPQDEMEEMKFESWNRNIETDEFQEQVPMRVYLTSWQWQKQRRCISSWVEKPHQFEPPMHR